ncbi:hypothetical protein BCV72DRAFT_235694, partial [Rhizopus microsporus var. microsporus]
MLLKSIMKTSNPEKIAAYTISWHFVKLHMEKKFSAFENESDLSEDDFVVKIWKPILEALFSETCVVLRWDGALSQVAQEGEMARRRMDLRFRCSSGNSNDVSDAGFGKKACVTKLYYDKKKLMTNEKAQL